MLASAFCFPYIRFERAPTYYILFWSMLAGMFCNGAAYAVASISGDYWLLAPHEGYAGAPGPDRDFTVWSVLSLAFVPLITGLSCFVAFPMFLYGLSRGNGVSMEGSTTKTN